MKARAIAAARSRKSLISFGLAALLSLTAAALLTVTAATAQAAAGSTGIDASGDYRQEVQACVNGRTPQDRETCLREARNAQAERQRGAAGTTQFDANAAARCDVLTGEDKAACRARVMGYGSTSGSVAGGGILREVETVVMPPGASTVTIQPQTTSEPVVLVPAQ